MNNMNIEDAINYLDDFSCFSVYQEAWNTVYDYIQSLEDDVKRMIMMLDDKE